MTYVFDVSQAMSSKRFFVDMIASLCFVVAFAPGRRCFYCNKYFSSQIKAQLALTLGEYEAYLGGENDRVQTHVQCVDSMVESIINNGGNSALKVDWDGVKNNVKLKQVKKRDTVKKKPGYSHVELKYYESQHGSLDTNGKRKEGHVEYQLDGIDGILIPDAPITRIEFNEHDSAEVHEDKTGDLPTSKQDLLAKQEAMASITFPVGQPALADTVDMLMESALRTWRKDGSRMGDGEDEDGKQPKAPQPKHPSMAPATHLRQAPMVITPPRNKLAPAPVPVHPGQAPDANADEKGSPTPKAKAVAAGPKAKAVAKSKGRPKKDWVAYANEKCKEFAKASPVDALWWGAEAKTQAKSLKTVLIKELSKRLSEAQDLEESANITRALKASTAMVTMIEVVSEKGFDSDEFKKAYDGQTIALSLEPKVEFAWPPHVENARHKMEVQATENVDTWYGRISSAELQRRGSKSPEAEQERLVSERLVRVLKGSDHSEVVKQMAELFSIEREVDLVEQVASTVTSLAVCLHYYELEDLADRNSLLREALDYLSSQCIPDMEAQRRGTMIGNAMMSYPKGRKIFNDSKLYALKLDNSLKRGDALATANQSLLDSCRGVQLVACSSAQVSTLRKLADAYFKMTAIDSDKVLDDVLREAGERTSVGVTALCVMTDAAWKSVFGSILVADATTTSLNTWLETTKEIRTSCSLMTDVLKPLKSSQQAWLTRCQSLSQWFADVHLVDGGADLETCKSLKRTLATLLDLADRRLARISYDHIFVNQCPPWFLRHSTHILPHSYMDTWRPWDSLCLYASVSLLSYTYQFTYT